MSWVKVVRNGEPGQDEVVFARVMRWVAGVVAVIIGGLLISGILALFHNAQETHDNTQAMTKLTKKLDDFVETSKAQWERSQVRDEELRIGQEALKRRMTLLDKKVD